MAKLMELNPEEGVFGLPPRGHISSDMIKNSMPVMQILPGKPEFEAGMTLFSINPKTGVDEYKKILANHGFSITTPDIKLAYIADNFPTDTFTNEYGESFLQKFTDVASGGMQQIAQMTNAGGGIEALKNLGTSLGTAFEGVEGGAGKMLQGAASGAVKAGQGLETLKNNLAANGPMFKGALNSIDRMLAGHRVDFPQIWRSSGYAPSHTATIRLYNPAPGNPTATKRHIVGPLAVILCLALPHSADGETFTWPFFHRIKSTGIYVLEPAVITNVTVIKGGDQQQISFNQKLAMVDVRIDFTSLYNSMVLEKDPLNNKFKVERPTMAKYLAGLEANDPTLVVRRNAMRENHNRMMATGTSTNPNSLIAGGPSPTNDAALSQSASSFLAKVAASKNRKAPTIEDVAVGNRVSPLKAELESSLRSTQFT